MKDNYRICFAGLGSIGKRHVRNVAAYLDSAGLPYQIDAYRSGAAGLPDEETARHISRVYYDMRDVPRNYDIVFITNPTHLHYATLEAFHDHAANFFIEKPVWDAAGLEKEKIRLDSNKKYYVACPLRYTKVIGYIKENIDPDGVISVQCTSSSYLPDWRKNTDYRKTYSAHRDMGGGVATDLIHEWDYLYYLFGKPESVRKMTAKVSDLEVDCEDIAVYIAGYPRRIVELHLDYFGRTPVRQMILRTNEETIIADLINGSISFPEKGACIDLPEERDEIQMKEIRNFFDIIEGRAENMNPVETAEEVLRLTQGKL